MIRLVLLVALHAVAAAGCLGLALAWSRERRARLEAEARERWFADRLEAREGELPNDGHYYGLVAQARAERDELRRRLERLEERDACEGR